MPSLTPGSGRVDVRRALLYSWIAYWILAVVFLGLPAGVIAVSARLAAAEGRDPGTYLPVGIGIGALVLVVVLLLVASGPRHLAPQRVELNDRGLGIVRGSLAWARGGTVFVPWEDVHLVAGGVTKDGPPQNTLEVHLAHADRVSDPVVRWATLVPAGHTWKGTTATRPRIVLKLDHLLRTRLLAEFEVWRPQVCAATDEAVPEPAPQPTGEPVPVSPPAPAARPPAGDTPPPPKPGGAAREVDLRWQHAAGWFVTTGFCLYLGVGSLVVATVTAYLGRFETTVTMLVLGLLLSLTFRPLLRRAPQYGARQGIALDGAGLTLTRRAKGSTAAVNLHVPWSRVRHVSQQVESPNVGGRRHPRYNVDFALEGSEPSAELPHWASWQGDTLRLTLNSSGHTGVTGALRAVRPDLFPGA